MHTHTIIVWWYLIICHFHLCSISINILSPTFSSMTSNSETFASPWKGQGQVFGSFACANLRGAVACGDKEDRLTICLTYGCLTMTKLVFFQKQFIDKMHCDIMWFDFSILFKPYCAGWCTGDSVGSQDSKLHSVFRLLDFLFVDAKAKENTTAVSFFPVMSHVRRCLRGAPLLEACR